MSSSPPLPNATMPSSSSSSTGTMKRADKRSAITILVLGDEGVGKSSLISTFVSRYFAEEVPGIMTRVRLPADPETHCVTTIVDSQGADAALAAAASSLSSSLSSTDSLAALMDRADGTTAAAANPTTARRMRPSASSPNMQQQQQQQAPLLVQDVSSARPAHRYAAAVGVDSVDSIVLVDDLDRVETFFRLENHWLPLIERCYQGKVPVIVAENKMDLFFSSTGTAAAGMTEEQARARKRQQIVSLMQRFPFVRQCIKCSAKHLLRVDDVFFKAQQAVLYPFTPPLYDLERGRLTVECKRALTRIFRIYDKDYDGLLSDAELDHFQRDTYHLSIFDRDFAAWKKVVTRHVVFQEEPVVQDGKFTVAGFWGIFDVFISQNRLDVVWEALRKFGYDDDLNLHVPDSVLHPVETAAAFDDFNRNWKLTSAAKRFLTSLFHQYDSNKDGSLSPHDILNMFSILPPPALPPWHPTRAPQLFEKAFSLPKESPTSTLSPSGSLSAVEASSSSGGDQGTAIDDPHLIVPAGTSSTSLPTAQSPVTPGTSMMAHSLSNSGLSFLSASDSLPSVDVCGMQALLLTPALSYLEWMGHWHTISAISPSVTRAELFRLGHVEDPKHVSSSSRKKDSSSPHKARRIKTSHPGGLVVAAAGATTVPPAVVHDATLKSREIRVLVLGQRGCGKTALLNALCGGATASTESDTPRTMRPETSCTFLKLRRKLDDSQKTKPMMLPGSLPITSRRRKSKVVDGEELVVHLVFTDVPETAAASEQEHLQKLNELFFGGSANPTVVVSPKDRVCDLAMLVFDATNPESWNHIRDVETKFLTKETPRVFVATKGDLLSATPAASTKPPLRQEEDKHCTVASPPTLLDSATIHCQSLDLEPPVVTTATTRTQTTNLLQHLAKCALREPGIDRLRSRPHEEQKRREAARRRKILWLGGIVSMSVVVAVGVGLLWGSVGSSPSSGSKKDPSKHGFGWLRSFFGSSSPHTAAASAKEGL